MSEIGTVRPIFNNDQVAIALVIPSRIDHFSTHSGLDRRANWDPKIDSVVPRVEGVGHHPAHRPA